MRVSQSNWERPQHRNIQVCYYRPPRSCGKVMFSQVSVILFTEGVWQTPPLGRHPPGRHPPWADIPPAQCMLGYTPCPVHTGIHMPPAQCMLGYTHTPAKCMLGYTPLPRRPLQRTVRILLKYILVLMNKSSSFTLFFRQHNLHLYKR